jgi:thioredoxin-like negative regulator of GroEL
MYPRRTLEPRSRHSGRAGCLLWAASFAVAVALSAWWLMRTPATAPATQAQPSETPRTSSALPSITVVSTLPALAKPASPTPSSSAAVAASCPLSAEPKSSAPSTTLISPNWYEGADGYERARRDHEPHRLPTFVYFFTDWCPHCRRFERELLTAMDVERFLSDQVLKVRVNPEASEEDRVLADRFGVHDYPRVLLLCDGQIPRSLSTHVTRDGEAVLRSPEEFVAEIERTLAQRVSDALRQARTQWQQDNAAAAIATIDEILIWRQPTVSLYVERALAHAAANAADAAIDDLRRAVEIDADEVRVFDTLDSILSRQQRWGESAACWARLLERQPTNPHALLERGDAFYHAGDLDRARADARAACRLGEARACELVDQLAK